jgi:hypothetical protein
MAQSSFIFRSRCFLLPKQGNSPAELEDAASSNEGAGRFAVADGASESICAGEWARLLAEAFVADAPDEEEYAAWLSSIQRRWQEQVGNQPFPWYVEEKLRDGAFATFLGLVIDISISSEVPTWNALAIGDCCLVRVRDDTHVRSFPVKSAKDFGTRPDLLVSRGSRSTRPLWSSGTLRRGDQIFMMTDALAQWFLAAHEAGRKPWRELAGITAEGFAAWVEALRKIREIKNDDVTLVAIETFEGPLLRPGG